MAIINPVRDYPSGDRSIVRVTWGPMVNGDTGAPVALTNWPDRSIQVAGTFGAGGSVAIRGSNDGTNFAALTDPQGSALTFSAAAIKICTEIPFQMQPAVTAGDGTTSLTVTAVFRTPTAIMTKA